MQSVVLVETGVSAGTGLVVADGRYVLTTASLVVKHFFVTVRDGDGTSATGTVTARDPLRDLAVIRLQGAGFPLTDTSFQGVPAVGENVAVVGYLQQVIGFPGLTRGVVTSIRADTDEGVRFIETDAPVSEESTGNPLVSYRGEIFGFVVSTTPLLRGDPVPGHAYALTMDDIRDALAQMGVLPG